MNTANIIMKIKMEKIDTWENLPDGENSHSSSRPKRPRVDQPDGHIHFRIDGNPGIKKPTGICPQGNRIMGRTAATQSVQELLFAIKCIRYLPDMPITTSCNVVLRFHFMTDNSILWGTRMCDAPGKYLSVIFIFISVCLHNALLQLH